MNEQNLRDKIQQELDLTNSKVIEKQDIQILLLEEDKKVDLNDELKKVLDETGSNPIEEKALYELLKTYDNTYKGISNIMIDVCELALKDKDVNIVEQPIEQMAEFTALLRGKITPIKDEDGIYKTTPDTRDLMLPNIYQARDLIKIREESNANIIKSIGNENSKEVQEEQDKIFKDFLWEISGLKKENLTEWEQILVLTQVEMCASDATIASMRVATKKR